MLNGRVRFLLLVQYSLLLLPVPTSLDQEEDTSGDQDHAAHDRQGEGPTDVVVLPIGHPIPAVASGAEYNHGYNAAHPRQSQVAAGRPQEQLILVVQARAAGVQNGQETSDQQQGHAQREEELRGDEEIGQKYVVYDVILLLEHPPAAIESRVIEMTWILKSLETYLPETDLDELRIVQLPVGLQPVGCGERDHHQNERHRRARDGGLARPRLPHHSRSSLGCDT